MARSLALPIVPLACSLVRSFARSLACSLTRWVDRRNRPASLFSSQTDNAVCCCRRTVAGGMIRGRARSSCARAHTHRYWLLDAASYYFDNALRLGQPDYCATDEDVIMTRIRTTGIDTTEFSEPPFMYSVVDVGGQRNERRKWIHCFDNVRVRVTAWLFSSPPCVCSKCGKARGLRVF